MRNDPYAGTMNYNLIYVFEIPDEAHKGYLKIGEHHFESASSYKQLPPNCDELNKHAKIRADQYTKTALIRYKMLYTELARRQIRLADGTVESALFSDKDVHEVLDRSGYDAHRFWDSDYPSEWYKVDLPTAIAAIKAVKEGRNTLTAEETPYLRLADCHRHSAYRLRHHAGGIRGGQKPTPRRGAPRRSGVPCPVRI